MALNKELKTSTGVELTYWRMSPDFTVDLSTSKVHSRLLPYVSKDVRAGGAMPVVEHMVPVVADLDRAVLDQRAVLYRAAKELEEFEGATDD